MSDKKCDEIEYEGEIYLRYNTNWVDCSGATVPTVLQNKLNDAFVSQIAYEDMSIEELVKCADKLRDRGSVGKAIVLYNEAIEKAESEDLKYILPKLTSSYSKQGCPDMAIEVYEEYLQLSKHVFSSALLTSVAAAYCDVDKFDEAMECAKRAQAISKGAVSGELAAVYGRINSNISWGSWR